MVILWFMNRNPHRFWSSADSAGPRGLAPALGAARGAAAAGARAAPPRGLGHRALRCLGTPGDDPRGSHGGATGPWDGTRKFSGKLWIFCGKYDEMAGLKWETCGLHHDVDFSGKDVDLSRKVQT